MVRGVRLVGVHKHALFVLPASVRFAKLLNFSTLLVREVLVEQQANLRADVAVRQITFLVHFDIGKVATANVAERLERAQVLALLQLKFNVHILPRQLGRQFPGLLRKPFARGVPKLEQPPFDNVFHVGVSFVRVAMLRRDGFLLVKEMICAAKQVRCGASDGDEG